MLFVLTTNALSRRVIYSRRSSFPFESNLDFVSDRWGIFRKPGLQEIDEIGRISNHKPLKQACIRKYLRSNTAGVSHLFWIPTIRMFDVLSQHWDQLRGSPMEEVDENSRIPNEKYLEFASIGKFLGKGNQRKSNRHILIPSGKCFKYASSNWPTIQQKPLKTNTQEGVNDNYWIPMGKFYGQEVFRILSAKKIPEENIRWTFNPLISSHYPLYYPSIYWDQLKQAPPKNNA